MQTARRLDLSRWSVDVAWSVPAKDALVPALADAGVQTLLLGGGRGGWVGALVRLLRAGPGYDLVHTHAPLPAAVARAAAPRRTALVHTEHNLWQRYHPATRAANAVTLRRNVCVLAVSDAVARSVDRRALGRVPLEVLHHGVDVADAPRGPAARAEARRRFGLAADDRVVGVVATFTPKKDHATLLEAVARLADVDRLVVLLVGTGPLADQVRARAADEDLAGRVRLLGVRDDVPGLLPGLDVLCLSSRYEGLPVVLMEAQAAGVPVVATRVGGVPEAVDDGVHGLLVPPADPPALAGALRRVLTDGDLAARLTAGAAAGAGRFDVARAARRHEELYAGRLGR